MAPLMVDGSLGCYYIKCFPYAAGGFGYSVGHFDIVVMYQFEKFKDKWDYEAYSFNRHHFSLNLGYHF